MIKEPQLTAAALRHRAMPMRADLILLLFIILFAILGLLASINGYIDCDKKISYLTPDFYSEQTIT